MKKLISAILLFNVAVLAGNAQTITTTKNSIVTKTPTAIVTSASQATTSNSIVQVDYYDGLGRPEQTVQVNGSSASADLATMQVYNQYGHIEKIWLPTPAYSNNGKYVTDFSTKASNGYSDSRAYTQAEYEPSPIARPTAVYSPGNEMTSHPATTKYAINNNMEVINYAMSGNGSIIKKGNYANGTLSVQIDADQDGCTTYTFIDIVGNVVLVRRTDGSKKIDTYYVYSNFDTNDKKYIHTKVCAVLPPGCNESNYKTTAYIYGYDERHRCVSKKIPGAEEVKYFYDNADRLTYSQDGEQRKRGVYTFYLYDQFNRVTSQGECSNTKGYNKSTLIWNFYDNYYFMQDSRFSGLSGSSVNAKGLKTGSIICVAGSPTSVQCEVYHYDYRGRLVKTIVKDVYGKVATYTIDYNFNDLITKQKEDYSSQKIVKTTTNTYDSQGRQTKEYTTIAVSSTTKATAQVVFAYNQVGRLGSKTIGTSNTEEIKYTYNTQGQLRTMRSSPFTEIVHYNTLSDSRAKKYYNGNISAIYWKHSNLSANTALYEYDKLNRLVNNTMLSGASYTETGFSYNDRGGITGFTRMSSGQSTKYTLTYSADNHLAIAQTNNGGLWSFSYDANGNQTTAPNKLTITYNLLNLPQQVKSGSTVKHKFAYLADGRKLHSISDPANDGGLAYIGSSVFNIGRGAYTSFESTSFSAGRIVRSGNGTYTVQYHITDHLGSVRAVLNQSMTVLEQNDYYPFGLRRSVSSSATTNRYHYNGKEDISATATTDYGARQYSAEFCQWMQVDPLAEKRYGISAYNFCSGNPINRIDPDGRDDFMIDKKTGDVKLIKKNDAPDRVLKTNRKGEIKYKKNGEAKIAIDGIEHGILKDGQNLKNKDQLICVGDKGQPTIKGVEDFSLKLSEYVGTEIAGAYFTKTGFKTTTHITIGKYKNNTFKSARGHGQSEGIRQGLKQEELTGFYHTHPSLGISASDRIRPSDADINSRNNALKIIPNLEFFIITAPFGYGTENEKIDYSNY